MTDSDLRISFSNIREASGSIYIALYDSQEAFMDPKQMRAQKIVPVTHTGSMEVWLGKFPSGKYALSCFHDVNGNGELDTNFLGIPTEPYGFSNNARPKFRAPYWSEAVFELKESLGTLSVKLERW